MKKKATLRVEDADTFIMEVPASKRKWVMSTKCRCGHVHLDHFKLGQVRGCSKCPCPAFDTIKVHREVTSESVSLTRWLMSVLLLFFLYGFSIFLAAFWWKAVTWILERL